MPAGQSRHVVEPGAAAYLPVWQETQVAYCSGLLLIAVYEPVGHSVHDGDDTWPLNVPAAQIVHDDWAAAVE